MKDKKQKLNSVDNSKKTNRQEKRKFKTKFKNLKEKFRDTQIIKKEQASIEKRKRAPSIDKNDFNSIKKMNKRPRGTANVKNTSGNIIDVTNLQKTYITGNTTYTALKDATFSIKKGEVVIILGPYGSGKSTLLNVLSGLDRSTKGQIIVNNVNLAALQNRELTTFRRENVGFIFQSYNLLPSLSARDNAEIGAILQRDPNKRIPVAEIFKKMDLIELIDSNIKNLSGGQQQRVSIARALSKNPRIIFADEPTGALDSVTAEKTINLLLDINKKYKTTIIFVTHNQSLTRIATKVINVKDGKVSVQA